MSILPACLPALHNSSTTTLPHRPLHHPSTLFHSILSISPPWVGMRLLINRGLESAVATETDGDVVLLHETDIIDSGKLRRGTENTGGTPTACLRRTDHYRTIMTSTCRAVIPSGSAATLPMGYLGVCLLGVRVTGSSAQMMKCWIKTLCVLRVFTFFPFLFFFKCLTLCVSYKPV